MRISFKKSVAPATLALLLGFASAGSAAEVFSGTLYFTTFQNQGGDCATTSTCGTNFWSRGVTYDSVTGFSLVGANAALANLKGADGLIFNPNDPTHLLIGEQRGNLVANVQTNGTVSSEKKSDLTGLFSVQAYGLVATPDGSTLVTFPNDLIGVAAGQNYITTVPLSPLFSDGTAVQVTGLDTFLRGGAYIKDSTAVSQLYYGDADDTGIGHLGQLTLGGATTRSIVVDDLSSGADVQGFLPSHGVSYDAYSNCLILSSGADIWQLCPDSTTPNKFHVVAKLHIPGTGPSSFHNWDQTTPDGSGHLFAANNDGNLLFVDYQDNTGNVNPSRLISGVKLQTQQFLAATLDDIANFINPPPPPGATGRMTGGGSVFTSDGTRVTHGFELHCNVNQVPNNLEINWPPANNFHLEVLTSAVCTDDPQIIQKPPVAPFDTLVGTGTGKLNGVAGASIAFTLVDAGEPGTKDTAAYVIKNSGGTIVLTVPATLLTKGNQQAHK